jgi:hypothetical protein
MRAVAVWMAVIGRVRRDEATSMSVRATVLRSAARGARSRRRSMRWGGGEARSCACSGRSFVDGARSRPHSAGSFARGARAQALARRAIIAGRSVLARGTQSRGDCTSRTKGVIHRPAIEIGVSLKSAEGARRERAASTSGIVNAGEIRRRKGRVSWEVSTVRVGHTFVRETRTMAAGAVHELSAAS